MTKIKEHLQSLGWNFSACLWQSFEPQADEVTQIELGKRNADVNAFCITHDNQQESKIIIIRKKNGKEFLYIGTHISSLVK